MKSKGDTHSAIIGHGYFFAKTVVDVNRRIKKRAVDFMNKRFQALLGDLTVEKIKINVFGVASLATGQKRKDDASFEHDLITKEIAVRYFRNQKIFANLLPSFFLADPWPLVAYEEINQCVFFQL